MHLRLSLFLIFASIAAQAAPVLPLKVSANHRYLVDQTNTPFLVLGDSPQSLLVNLTFSQMKNYLADRRSHGFDAILVMALCDSYTGGNPNGTTLDGVAPFTSGTSPSNYDLSTPNSQYFSRLDKLISSAAQNNLVVFLDPIETGGWLTTLENNGQAKAYNFGKFLGNRYKNSPNIVWESGNDFQSWNTSTEDNDLVYAVMAGIAAADRTHVQTIELNYNRSYSDQDPLLSHLIFLDAAYTYYETYDEVLTAYNSVPSKPVFLTEANYEYEDNTGQLQDPAGVFVLREQEYWTMTSGACGQLYGNHYTWTFTTNWQDFLDSPGTIELSHLTSFFSSIPWWQLIPDQDHQIVTSGYGTYDANNEALQNANYVTTAWIPNGSLAVIYDPAGNTLTVNLSSFNSPVFAYWYDPSNGNTTLISGSPFPNTGSQTLSTPGNNGDGQTDWLLELSTNQTGSNLEVTGSVVPLTK